MIAKSCFILNFKAVGQTQAELHMYISLKLKIWTNVYIRPLFINPVTHNIILYIHVSSRILCSVLGQQN